MRANMMLCNAAERLDNGLMNMEGAGRSVFPSPTPESALAIKLEIPWSMANTPLQMELDLVNADGRKLGGVTGEYDGANPLPETPPGVPLDSTLVVPLPSFSLVPGRYAWQLKISDEHPEGGYLGFTVR
ncbi:hypothetical protein AB0I00_19365 [Streptomyces sp. NPDC050803]|uniref:DUF6941 family protein n=1 Tax=unclassified Streptomyces TaxID=2593676 RepID=UPI0034234FEF